MAPITKIINYFLEFNPQLFREVRGKLKPRNIIVFSLISAITQSIIALIYFAQLPDRNTHNSSYSEYSRYCFKLVDPSNYSECTTDLLGNWMINWQLLWLDIFIALSVVGIFSLLVVGTYMLIADLTKEESRGTLNFVRLSPQSASSILLGKILGVPILLYLVIAIALPLHFLAGLKAHIPLNLILAFDLVTVISCAFCYSLALSLSLINSKLPGFKPWLGSGSIFFFLFVTTSIIFNSHSVSNTPADWLTLFNPARSLTYLVDATYLPRRDVYYLDLNNIKDLLFYGQPLWAKASTGIGFILFNYSLWTYWLWQGLKRRFHNPISTLWSKQQSYWITGCFVAVTLGFTLQTTQSYDLFDNFLMLQLFLLVMFLGLTTALSPHRQTLQDWVRYRHQLSKEGKSLGKELLFGEKSPSTVAIAINLLIAIVYILPSLVLFPFEDESLPAFWGLLLSANMILFYAAIVQWMLIQRGQRRAIWASLATLAVTILPVTGLALASIEPSSHPALFFFTFLPIVATEYAQVSTVILSILGQWLAIALVGWQMTRQLRQARASETKILLSEVN